MNSISVAAYSTVNELLLLIHFSSPEDIAKIFLKEDQELKFHLTSVECIRDPTLHYLNRLSVADKQTIDLIKEIYYAKEN